MTATDELLTLLKEHGVEHYEHEAPATDCIAFFDGNGWHDCWESVDGEVNVTFSMTPEQAIAATLGATDANPTQAESSGTCHKVRVHEEIEDEMHCSECGRFLGFAGDIGAPPYNYCPNCGRRIVEPTTNDVDAEVGA